MKKAKTSMIYPLLAALLVLGLAGCGKALVKKSITEWKEEGNVEKLLIILNDADRRKVITAAQALGELKAEQAIEPLAALLSSTDSQLVVATVEALVSIGTEPAETHLISALELKDRWARTTAINGLGSLKSTRAITPLAQTLDSDDEKIATAAADALGLIHSEKAVMPLVAKLESPSSSLRFACVKSLGSIGGQDAAVALSDFIGDPNDTIRKTTIDTLVATGKFAEPYALKALSGKNEQARQSAATILKSIDAIPAGGKYRFFYLLAQIPPQSKKVDRRIVLQLAELGSGASELLLKAVSYDSVGIREHAFRALEAIGEPCVAQAVKAVEQKATPAGKQWFSERGSWVGAPSWRIDLWAAATALNPKFKSPGIEPEGVSPREFAIRILTTTQYRVPREIIPLIIPLLAPIIVDTGQFEEEPGTTSLFGTSIRRQKTSIDFGETAEQRLLSAGDTALFPLIAASESHSLSISNSCKKLIQEITTQPAEDKGRSP